MSYFGYMCIASLFLACFIFASCAKDYPRIVKERVEQYRKEGKWILSSSKNATKDEHFIVYADEKAQTIEIDTLDGIRTIKLDKLTDVNVALTFCDTKIVDFMEGGNLPLKVKDHGFAVAMGYADMRQSEKLRGYKDKYMIMDMGEGTIAVLFFTNKKVYKFGGIYSSVKGRDYTGTNYRINRNGDLDVRIKYGLEHNGDGLPDYLPCTYEITFDSEGNIKNRARHVTCCGVKVPVEAFKEYVCGDLTPYIEEMKRNMGSGDLQDDFSTQEDESDDEEWSTNEPEETSSGSNNVKEKSIVKEPQSQPQIPEQQKTDNSNKSVPVEKESSSTLQKELDEKVFDVVEVMPSFPGGNSALMEYLNGAIQYPVAAMKNGVQGRVVVSFVVERDGSITNVQIARSVDPSLDKEAMRVIRQMPKWNPGRQNGNIVRVRYNLPVSFRLQ